MQDNSEAVAGPFHQKPEDIRTGMNAEAIRQSVLDNLFFQLAKTPQTATRKNWYMALAYTVRDRLIQRWVKAQQNYTEDLTVVAYLSSEFLIGPQLANNLINLNIYNEVSHAIEELGMHLDELIEQEGEPGLGNSGIGRLAACYLDSLTTLQIPLIGYGIRYEFGSFKQDFSDGWQTELTDKWLVAGNPWEIPRPEITYTIKIGGYTESYYDEQDCYRVRWIPKFSIKGIAYDIPISGYRVSNINTLRLWKSESIESFDYETFNVGDYFSAVNEKIASESIGKILYPDDEPYAGKHLRLAQQFFLVSCALQDMIRLHLLRWENIHSFSNSFAVQLIDTNSAIAVAELMRLLVDEHLVSWEKAWYITQNTFSYTNHATLPEALEKWNLPMFASILPRHLEIIYEINRRFLDEIWLRCPDNNDKISRLSIIDESDQKYVRMAHLATLGSHAINGVSETQSELLKKKIFPDLYELYPERFLSITNGVTPRRWIVLSNPRLTKLITNVIGDQWINQFIELRKLEAFVDDLDFVKKWIQVKKDNKHYLAKMIYERTNVQINPDSLFDVHMTRFQEYKRQHLNVLHIISLYNKIKKNPQVDITPRTFIFGGKASPGYFIANLIIKLINSVAEVVNNDPDVSERLKVVFFPNFNIKNSQNIYIAADLSEQISLAGREASGTGSMKFSMNGALTIGTLNGSNIEIREEVGADNFFLFGLTPDEVASMKSQGYNPLHYYNANPELKEVIDLITSGFFFRKDVNLFKPLIDSLLCRDEYMVLADYQSYVESQYLVSMAFKDQNKWAKSSLLTVARMGKFSSDRAIHEYNEKIWHAEPFRIDTDIDTKRS